MLNYSTEIEFQKGKLILTVINDVFIALKPSDGCICLANKY